MENIIKTKKDLEVGDIIVLRNGDELLLVDDDEFYEIKTNNGCWMSNDVCDLADLKDNLMFDDNSKDSRKNDVMLVKRPAKYDIVFDRTNDVKEMTIEEISNLIGYEVKIVKENK